MMDSLLSILLLMQQDAVSAFAPPHPFQSRMDDVKRCSRTASLTSAPIRKSGSLFGLTEFTKQSTATNNNTSIEFSQQETRDGKINQHGKFTASDESTITVLKKKKNTSNVWDESIMQGQLQDLDELSMEEDDVDMIANELLASHSIYVQDSVTSGDNVGDYLESKQGRLKREAEDFHIALEGEELIINDTDEYGSVTKDSVPSLNNVPSEATENIGLSIINSKHNRDANSRRSSSTHSIQDYDEQIRIEKSLSHDDELDDSSYGLLKEVAPAVSIDVNSSQERKLTRTILDQDRNFCTESYSETESDASKLDGILAPSPLDVILSTATSFLSPKPPFAPPTVTNIMNSSNDTSTLIEINAWLEQTSCNQREDLGRLRRKVHDLERQLIRAKRDKVSHTKEEVNRLKKDCERKVDIANDTVSQLEEEVKRMKKDMTELNEKLMLVEEAKERVAAEYGFVTKAYTEVKHALDTQSAGWEEKIESLEQQITDANQQAHQWKDECANKANALESSRTRIVQMQAIIEELQSSMKTKEQEIKRLLTTEGKETERKMFDAKRELRHEYEQLLSKKSRKIGEVRMALRSANEKRRKIEAISQRETAEALNEMHNKMTGQIDELRFLLAEKETEMKAEAEGIVEDREHLLAEMMFLTRTVERLQINLTSDSKKYDDLTKLYEEETSALCLSNAKKDDEIEGLVQANTKIIVSLESKIEQLNMDIKKERALKDESEAQVSKLTQRINSLTQESQTLTLTYKTKVDELQSQIQQLEDAQNALVEERDGSLSALDQKDTDIAILEQELAEKINEVHTYNITLSNVNSQLEELLEKKRVNELTSTLNMLKQNTTIIKAETPDDAIDSPLRTYERKIQTLTQQNLLSQQLINTKLVELSRLRSRLDEMSTLTPSLPADESSTGEDIAELKSTIDGLSQSSRQSKAQAKDKLLRQNQTLADQKTIIDSLTMQIKNTEMGTPISEEEATSKSTVTMLKMELEDTKNRFSTWKAKANGKLLENNRLLITKEDHIQQLRKKLDAMIHTQKEAKSSNEISDESMKAKEKLRLKNNIIKQRDDVIAELNTQLNDLEFEKKKVEQTLEEETKRNTEFYRSYEMQIRAMEEKLSRRHASEIHELESEMNETIHQLEVKIQDMAKIETNNALRSGTEATDSLRINELQAALQESKEKEVSLINTNMMMKNQIDNLEAQKKLLVMSATDRDKIRENNKTALELPSYYKDSKRARLRRVLGSAWRRISRR